ncbi:MAG: Dyp-type peroxidase family [Motiliproteus sp.]|jgi:Dyp-type peroxidase family
MDSSTISPQYDAFNELHFSDRLKNVWQFTQRGLVYPSPHAVFALAFLDHSKPVDLPQLQTLMLDIRQQIHHDKSLQQRNSSVVLGVEGSLYKKLCQQSGQNIPKGLALNFPDEPGSDTSTVFARSSKSFKNSGAQLWFHIKSDSPQACQLMLNLIKEALDATGLLDKIDATTAASKSNEADGSGGKVLGCRFSENLNNPTDPVTIAKHSIIGTEDLEHLGGSYVLAQRFKINWEQLHMMSEDQIENIIGRKTDDTIIPTRDTRTHIKSARMQDENGNTTPILRLGLPFGESPYNDDPALIRKGSNVADEKGIFFAGYARSLGILENIMDNQIGNDDDYMNDRLFNNAKSDLGGFFYIPSSKDLGLIAHDQYTNQWQKKQWSQFPGVNWDRLDRHFNDKSDSEYMSYNHKHYLYKMSTMSDEDRQRLNPPSNRILSLLENSFSRWQDGWYIDRKQQEMGELKDYINDYQGDDKPTKIMNESIMIRKGWAIRLTLHLYTSESYGFRGRRLKINNELKTYCAHYNPPEGEVVNGADTFRIEPEEIIVGGMPNLSLGQGRYVIKYLSEDERFDAFVDNLSEASGVGHVIPDFEQLLDKGLDQMINDIEIKQAAHLHDSDAPEGADDLCQSAILALRGVSEFNLRYAELAASMAEQHQADGQMWEHNNLRKIAQRMNKLAHHKPETMIEALQLIYTLHCCMHMNGEPTSLGRVDQMINPFYEADLASKAITEEAAQEAMDAFFIKLDEKVQQNRIHVEDHQPFGNLAMGGSSGPYPQGGGINQWVQQLTVGGAVANEDEIATPAYNTITKLCLRSARRLPLNAPCLSLRVRKEIPDDIVEEAAKAILSGGAHPILLNDDKFIEGILTSGDHVGGEDTDMGEGWNSQVSLKSARNYACDGCYEPMFPGESWFSLGGFTTLQPLECAMNKGRTYASAGMGFLHGQAISFTSEDPAEIKTFERLYQLFIDHFEWLNRKAAYGQLGSYGNNTAICPSPLLSAFTHDCIAKGRDYYDGGALYNIYGPCYVGLSTTINSLHAIEKMVFDPETAVTSLAELVECLSCDWGYKMVEPFISQMAGESRIVAKADRFKRLREIALKLPRFGRDNSEVDDEGNPVVSAIDQLGNRVINDIATISVETFTVPKPKMQARLIEMATKMGRKDHPFGIQIQPGVGTFENHVENGVESGASADGRRESATIASDMSSAPSPSDMPPQHQNASFTKSLSSFNMGDGPDKLTNGAPTDFNIQEDFPLESLKQIIHQFATGDSANVLTITTASPVSFTQAMSHPERYDLLRVRTGGWTEYFTAMFPDKQEQHRRRPVSMPDK